jgi:hypothetical protein
LNTYTLRLQPRYGAWSTRPLTHDVIASALEGAVVRQLEADGYGRVVLDLALRRASHADALNEIAFAVQDLGYSVIQATATEWTRSLVEGILLGAAGGGGAGATMKNPGFAFLAAMIGALAGGLIGSSVQREKIIFDVSRTSAGWRFTPVQPDTAPAHRPGLA